MVVIIDSMDTSLSKLWEIEDREAWRDSVHGVAKEWNMTERLDNNPNCGLRTPLSEWFASGCGVEDNIFPKGRLPVCRVNLKTPLGPEDLNTSFPSDKGGLFGPPHIVSY